jgi:hypothetical protein
MINKIMMNVKTLAIFAIVLVSMASFVGALGVGMPYSSSHPLEMSPGESKEVLVNLQNGVGTEDVTVQLAISEGNEIAWTPSSNYVLQAKTFDTFAPVTISIPGNASVGKVYNVKVSMNTLAKSTGGQMISLGFAADSSFPVKVVAEVKEERPAFSLGDLRTVVIVIIILLILWMIISAMKSKGKKKRK